MYVKSQQLNLTSVITRNDYKIPALYLFNLTIDMDLTNGINNFRTNKKPSGQVYVLYIL